MRRPSTPDAPAPAVPAPDPLPGTQARLRHGRQDEYDSRLGALGGSGPSQDATVVTRLRDAGLILLGKGNMSAWNDFRAPEARARGTRKSAAKTGAALAILEVSIDMSQQAGSRSPYSSNAWSPLGGQASIPMLST